MTYDEVDHSLLFAFLASRRERQMTLTSGSSGPKAFSASSASRMCWSLVDPHRGVIFHLSSMVLSKHSQLAAAIKSLFRRDLVLFRELLQWFKGQKSRASSQSPEGLVRYIVLLTEIVDWRQLGGE